MLIPRSVLSSLIVASDTESSRYALGGLRIERDAKGYAVAVATDGRRLMCVEWNDADMAKEVPEVGDIKTAADPDSEFTENGTILSVADCKAIARAAKPKVAALRRKPELAFVAMEEATANGTVRLAASDGQTVSASEVRPVEGRFPKYRDVIPQYRDDECVRVRLDARFIADLADATERMAGSDMDHGLTLVIPTDDGRAVLLEKETADIKVQAVLMPLAS
jgi:hypothetical protein